MLCAVDLTKEGKQNCGLYACLSHIKEFKNSSFFVMVLIFVSLLQVYLLVDTATVKHVATAGRQENSELMHYLVCLYCPIRKKV
jgi:hypothetical protein